MSNIKTVTEIEAAQTYDLEVDHPDHQFYLSNGVLTSNSHSILYSMISYHTAYLKAHYPIEFLLANLMSELRSNTKDAKENIEKIKQELRNKGIKINPPNINTSSMTYEIQPDGSLLTGFEALKSVGTEAIQDIIAKRPFESFGDLMLRTDSRQVRSTVIQSLAASGCLDSFDIPKNRKSKYLYCSDYRKKMQVWLKKHDPNNELFIYDWPEEKEWGLPELYALEKSYLGESFICDKTKAYSGFFDTHSTSIKEVRTMHDRELIPAMRVEIKSIFEFKVKKETSKYLGQDMIKATVEDEHGDQITLTVFPNKWKEAKSRMKDMFGNRYKFEEGVAIHFSGSVNVYEDQIGIVLENLFSACPPPALPKDLKAKKISRKSANTDRDLNKIDISSNIDEYLMNIEDVLYDEGLINLDHEDDN